MLSSITSLEISYAQHPPDNTIVLELLDQIERLEEEVRHIRGEMEIQRHQIEILIQDQELSESQYPQGGNVDLPKSAFSVEVGEGYPPNSRQSRTPMQTQKVAQTPAQPRATTIRNTEPSPSISKSGTEEQAAFDLSLNEFRISHYPEAITGFKRFLITYPDSKLAADTQYWLGESYYKIGDHNSAKEAFINLGLQYPKSELLPDALLKLGYIYGEIDDTIRGKEVLEKLLQVYPDTHAAELAKVRLQSFH
jgi:tol-pal system protein YbgF